MNINSILKSKAFGSVSEGKHSWSITKIEVKENDRGGYLVVHGTVDGTEQSYTKALYSEIDIENFINAIVDNNNKLANKTVEEVFTEVVNKNTTITMWLIPSGDYINIRYKEPAKPKDAEDEEDAE